MLPNYFSLNWIFNKRWSITNFSQRLKELRLSLGLTQVKMAKTTQVSQSNYSKYENGTVEPSYSFITSLHTELNINSKWLLTGQGQMLDSNIVTNDDNQPLVFKVKAYLTTNLTNIETKPNRLVTIDKSLVTKDVICFEVGDASLAPKFYKGDIVFVKPITHQNSFNKRVCVVKYQRAYMLNIVSEQDKMLVLHDVKNPTDTIVIKANSRDINIIGTLVLHIKHLRSSMFGTDYT